MYNQTPLEIMKEFSASSFSLSKARIRLDEIYGNFSEFGVQHLVQETISGVDCYTTNYKPSKINSVILFVHGGGFSLGSSIGHRHVISRISELTQYKIISVEYSLSPDKKFPSQIHEVESVYQHLLENYGCVYIIGYTAGGNIALSLCQLKDIILPKKLVLVSPPTNLSFINSYDNDYSGDWVTHEKLMSLPKNYLVDMLDIANPMVSPTLNNNLRLPETLLQVGENEILLPSVLEFYNSKKAFNKITLSLWENMFHGWHNFGLALNSAENAIKEISEFVS
jgi:monoterpene epsilon-lactone hydrolase|tara:strand:+ start:52373 stop:53215 length:843 start_codon:yes stop_codon:yes gene_type:complete